jgi:hypothetical protein
MKLDVEHPGMVEWALSETPLIYKSWKSWKQSFIGSPNFLLLPKTLYRGHDSGGWLASIDAGAAWTQDIHIAEFFARWSAGQGQSMCPGTKPLISSINLTDEKAILAVYPIKSKDRTNTSLLLVEGDLAEVVLDSGLINYESVTTSPMLNSD